MRGPNMQLCIIIFLLLGLSSVPNASSSAIRRGGVYKVNRVPNSNYNSRNGPQALLRALRKYGMPVPASVEHAAAVQDEILAKRNAQERRLRAKGRRSQLCDEKSAGGKVGLVTAAPEADDVEYLSPVKIGGQTLNLGLDTGSADFFVFNTQLNEDATKWHAVYDPQKSRTYAPMEGASFHVSYSDGSSASGTVGTDTVELGGVTVTAQAIELPTSVAPSFIHDTANDGLLGLAFGKLNGVRPNLQKTFFENAVSSLAEPLFTADLRPKFVGAYEFGRIDSTKYTGPLSWVPVDPSEGLWQFTSEFFAVNGSDFYWSTRGKPAIADTGTSLLLVDRAVTTAYYEQIAEAYENPSAGGWVFPCNTPLPDLQLDVGGAIATIKGRDIRFAQSDEKNCYGGLQTATGVQVFGDVFFKSNFVVFHGGNNSIGFAEHI
ncbi:acid protease [Xylariaceae sp. FL1651]|nr:acid protease [Xylariaceae sp. FL1651]